MKSNSINSPETLADNALQFQPKQAVLLADGIMFPHIAMIKASPLSDLIYDTSAVGAAYRSEPVTMRCAL